MNSRQPGGKARKVLFIGVLFLIAAGIIAFILAHTGFSLSKMVLLNPKGIIALKERNVMFAAVSLMLILVIPTFIFTIVIARKYSAENQPLDPQRASSPETLFNQASFGVNPNAEKKSNRLVIAMWWILPAIIIFFLSIVDWTATHELDPYQPIHSNVPVINVQVVAMQWKWLFIYPGQDIATVNFLEIPVNTPIRFSLTSDDAPMNSFWIPQLSGQIYTMTGMSTQLNLMATAEGSFSGRGAELSGQGFSGMAFTVRSVSSADFNQWVKTMERSPNILSTTTYQALLAPSENVPVTFYSNVTPNLYGTMVMKYMAMPSATTSSTNTSAEPAGETASGSMGNMDMGKY